MCENDASPFSNNSRNMPITKSGCVWEMDSAACFLSIDSSNGNETGGSFRMGGKPSFIDGLLLLVGVQDQRLMLGSLVQLLSSLVAGG
mmetsp:Transcript_8271/g.24835  ORF Transcript_8271/g.24835 Transcript_8271/m.24835 type:complete len:88 (+) Transcript_8271:1507-1770(+)